MSQEAQVTQSKARKNSFPKLIEKYYADPNREDDEQYITRLVG